jgi:hypothetical protein
MKTLRQQKPPGYDLCGRINGETAMTEMIKIPKDTYQRLIEHFQAHAPTDSWAAELLKELEREAKPVHQLPTGSYLLDGRSEGEYRVK